MRLLSRLGVDAWPAEPVIVALIVLGGVAFLLPDVSRANLQIFDEHYYVDVARHYAKGELVDPQWGSADPRPWNFEHPPLPKFAISLSLRLEGDKPAAWRLPSVLVGAAGYAAAYLLGRNAFGSRPAGLASAAFLAMDPMYYIHARLAQLEIFPAVFLAFSLAALLDPARPRLTTAGVWLGLAVACKYSAFFAGPALLVVAALRLRSTPLRQNLRPLALNLFLLPGLILSATYVPYFVAWARDGGLLFSLKEFAWVQSQMFVYGYGGHVPPHAYQSGPASWFFLTVPIYYFYRDPPGDLIGWIYTVGNPASWWSALLAIAAGSVWWVRSRTQEARGFAWIGLAFAASLLPYFFAHRILLNFYATQYTPLLAVAAGGLFGVAWRRGGLLLVAAVVYGAIVAATWTIYYPLASGVEVRASQVDWVFSLVPWMRRLPVPGVWPPG